jgi:hypothetical protein
MVFAKPSSTVELGRQRQMSDSTRRIVLRLSPCIDGWIPGKAVADPRFGQHVLRMGRIEFELLPQLSHQHTQVLLLRDTVDAPDSFENGSVRQDAPGMRAENREQFELFRCEANLGVAAMDATPVEVNHQVTMLHPSMQILRLST